MTHAGCVRTPADCTSQELQVFEDLVRQAFAGSDEGLAERIATARWLAFERGTDGDNASVIRRSGAPRAPAPGGRA